MLRADDTADDKSRREETMRWGRRWAARGTLPTIAGALAAVLACSLPAAAQTYPDRLIKLIVPFGPGGPPDVAARIIGDWLSNHLGTVVVENHAGAGGTLAGRLVAQSVPDGYTLMTATAGSLAISPQLYKNSGIDPVKDFAAVALVSSAPLVLTVHKSVPAATVKELVAYTNANPGKLNYGAVMGTPPHLTGEMFKFLTGADIVFVPYKTAAQATTDVLTDHMNMTFEGTTAIVPHIQSGELRGLAVMSRTRIPQIPDVPTLEEAGYKGMPPDSWQGIVAPAGTPAAIVRKLNAAVNGGLANTDVRRHIADLGGEARPGTPEEFAAFIAAEKQRWGEVIRVTRVTVE
jgi:tripartite-type tricarboxylate transporter receptor subunit TctC